MISLRNLVFAYDSSGGGFRLGPIDLTMQSGQVHGWAGTNGSGKSTLASILAGHRTANSGSIAGLPKRVLYFQQHAVANVFPDLTVREHLLLSRDDSRHRHILKLFPSLDGQAHKYPDALSGGQLQRLAFSLSLVRDFDLYIFDEITNHLDAETVAMVGATIRAIVSKRPSVTVVFISHDAKFLSDFSDSVTRFEEGRILAAAR